MKEITALTCYLTRDERREVQTIADKEERAETKIVQFAVRVFMTLYKQDPEKVLEMAHRFN